MNAHGPLYDSRRGVGIFYRYQPRDLERLCNEKDGVLNRFRAKRSGSHPVVDEVRIETPKIHHSVQERISTGTDSYAPVNLPARYAVVQEDGLILETDAGTRLADGSIAIGDGNMLLDSDGELRYAADETAVCSRATHYILYEDANQASARRGAQETVWNKVWLRRLAYGFTIAFALVFILFPLFPESDKVGDAARSTGNYIDSGFGTVGPVLRNLPTLAGSLPGLGFASGFFEWYADEWHPYVFFVLLLIIAALIVFGSYLKTVIEDRMKDVLRPCPAQQTDTPERPGRIAMLLADMRNSPSYELLGKQLPRAAGEVLSILFFIVLAVLLMSRISLVLLDGFGLVCDATPRQSLSNVGPRQDFSFDPQNHCQATGIRLERGKSYIVEMRIGDCWKDGGTCPDNETPDGVAADIYGWRDGGHLKLFAPLRRHLLVDWYQPVARIHNKAFDRYPLLSGVAVPPPNQRGSRCLRQVLDARTTGELFLYVNDAVAFTPKLVPLFYDNNNPEDIEQHRAMVRITDRDSFDAEVQQLCDPSQPPS